MKNARILRIDDLVQEVKRTDDQIALHRNLSDDDFMVQQYIARKDQLFAKLITELANSALASVVSFQLVQQLIAKFYTNTGSPAASDIITDLEELRQLALTA